MMSPFVKIILLSNGIAFVLQALTYPVLDIYCSLYEYTDPNFYPWQPFTYMFLHGNTWHLVFNMLIVWMFGTVLEGRIGDSDFLRVYFVSGVLTGVVYAFTHSGFRLMGASAGAYGLLSAFAYFWPNQILWVMGIFPMRAKILILLLMVIGFVSESRPGISDNIAHAAHVFGACIAFAYLECKYARYGVFQWQWFVSLFKKLAEWIKKTCSSFGGRRRSKTLEDMNGDNQFYTVYRSSDLDFVSDEEDKLKDIQQKIIENGLDSLTKEEKEIFEKELKRRQ